MKVVVVLVGVSGVGVMLDYDRLVFLSVVMRRLCVFDFLLKVMCLFLRLVRVLIGEFLGIMIVWVLLLDLMVVI